MVFFEYYVVFYEICYNLNFICVVCVRDNPTKLSECDFSLTRHLCKNIQVSKSNISRLKYDYRAPWWTDFNHNLFNSDHDQMMPAYQISAQSDEPFGRNRGRIHTDTQTDTQTHKQTHRQTSVWKWS